MATYNEYHGTVTEVIIGKFQRDRIGVVTGTVMRKREETRDAMNWALLKTSAAPTGDDVNNGVPCVNVERSHDGAAYGLYTYTYEGFDTGYEPSDTEMTYELDISMSEDPIQTHIRFKDLAAKYGWQPGLKEFMRFLPTQEGIDQTSGLGGDIEDQQQINPFYGVDSYLAVGAHYRVIYARRQVPADATSRVNEIVANPKGIEQFVLPGWAQRRNWLYLGPRITLRGNVSQISEEYIMSGPRGWSRDVYGAGKLGGSTQ